MFHNIAVTDPAVRPAIDALLLVVGVALLGGMAGLRPHVGAAAALVGLGLGGAGTARFRLLYIEPGISTTEHP